MSEPVGATMVFGGGDPSVANAPAMLDGEFAAHPEDANGDGLYETLWIDAGLAVRRAGRYQVWMRLVDADENFLANGHVELDLPEGPALAAVALDGADIRVADVDGPYNVIGAELFALNEDGAVVDRRKLVDVLVTEPYRSRDFSAPALELLGPVSDEALDRDGDGRSDAVAITIGIVAREQGTYSLAASLDSSAYRYFAFADTGPVELEAGEHELTLVYDGLPFRSYKVDGPYQLAKLVAAGIDEAGKSEVVDRWHGTYATQPYTAAQFAPSASP